MVQITPFLYALPVLSRFADIDSTSNGLVTRQGVDTNSLPPACQSPCQVINTLNNCAGDLTCECPSSVGSQLQQCMNCLVNADPAVDSDAQAPISGWNLACNGSLTLGTGSGSSSSSGANTPSATGSVSSGGGSSSSSHNGAVSLSAGSIITSVAVAITGAFMSL